MAFITGNGGSFSKQMPTAKREQKMLLINWMYISRIATTVKLVLVQCSEQMLCSVLI